MTRKRERYAVRVGGFLDGANTLTWEPRDYITGPNGSNAPPRIAFEPNVSVTIENIGEADVVNPWIVVNGRRDWWSVETVAREIVGGRGLTEAEKAMALWRFCVENVYDSRCGLAWRDSNADPVCLLNVYGFGACIGQAVAARRLAEAMGLKAREVWIGGSVDGRGRGRHCWHTVLEVRTGESWALLDTDQGVFFLRRDNATVAGADDLADDPALLRRSHGYLGLPGRDRTDRPYYERFFRARDFIRPIREDGPPPRTMAMRLRPGERMVRRWANVGKTAVRGARLHPEVRFSNGRLVYAPDLGASLWRAGAESVDGLVRDRRGLRPVGARRTGEVVWRVAAPWAVVGGRVRLTYRLGGTENGIELLLSRDGKRWRSMWCARRGTRSATVDLDFDLNPALHDWCGERRDRRREGPVYGYLVKVALWAGRDAASVRLEGIELDSDILCATASLPALSLGVNAVAYRDDTKGDRRVRITHVWREDHTTRPPGAPRPAPTDGREFCWQAPTPGSAPLDDYHIQVSRYPDFRWPLCPTFDRYVSRTAWAGRTRWRPRFAGLLNHGATYYWRVRARNARGVWGPWSAGQAFTPETAYARTGR